jgi:hypothetical protein
MGQAAHIQCIRKGTARRGAISDSAFTPTAHEFSAKEQPTFRLQPLAPFVPRSSRRPPARGISATYRDGLNSVRDFSHSERECRYREPRKSMWLHPVTGTYEEAATCRNRSDFRLIGIPSARNRLGHSSSWVEKKGKSNESISQIGFGGASFVSGIGPSRISGSSSSSATWPGRSRSSPRTSRFASASRTSWPPRAGTDTPSASGSGHDAGTSYHHASGDRVGSGGPRPSQKIEPEPLIELKLELKPEWAGTVAYGSDDLPVFDSGLVLPSNGSTARFFALRRASHVSFGS